MKKFSLSAGFLLVLVCSIWAFTYPDEKLPMLEFPEQNEHTKVWDRIEKFGKDGLPESAIKVVDSLRLLVEQEQNHPQIIKTIIWSTVARSSKAEHSDLHALKLLLAEEKKASFPVKPILQSVIAEYLVAYTQNNYWQLQRRGVTPDFDRDRLETWSLAVLGDETKKWYLKSLASKDSLQRVEIDYFKPILATLEGDAERSANQLMPTLYDLLSLHAITYLRESANEVYKPLDQFELDDPAFFGPADEFVKLNIETSDLTSNPYRALLILQDMLRFQQRSENQSALVDQDILRLDVVKNLYSGPDGDALYEKALIRLAKKNQNHPAAAEVAYKLAVIYQNEGNQFKRLTPDESVRWKRKHAADICIRAIQKHPNSYGAGLCQRLLQQLQHPSFTLQMDRVMPADAAQPALLTYTNVNQLSLKIVKISQDLLRSDPDFRDKLKAYNAFSKRPTFTSWSLEPPVETDLQEHALQLEIPALPSGAYALLAESQTGVLEEDRQFTYTLFQVTNLSATVRDMGTGNSQLRATNLHTGQSISKAQVEWFRVDWNYDNGRSKTLKSHKTQTTDQEGKAEFSWPKSLYNLEYAVTYKGDTLSSTNSVSSGRNYRNQRNDLNKIFTDRSIYRPGQTIYFKGLVLKPVGDRDWAPKANAQVEVLLRNPNHEEVGKLTLKTNEYGSVQGQFTAPDGVTGAAYIYLDRTSERIQIEEYKRPQFEVSMDPLEGTPVLGDAVTVSGKAKAYSGAPITGAVVNYSVERKPYYPIWYRWWYPSISTDATVMAEGTLETDGDGAFEVNFDALPEKANSLGAAAAFVFEVTVDVVDINGETHASTKSLRIGKAPFSLDVSIAEVIQKEKLEAPIFEATNANGDPVEVTGNWSVFMVEEPENILRERRWARPDRFVFSKAEFAEKFPHDPYDNESDKTTWPLGKRVLERSLGTAVSKASLSEEVKSWKPGQYVLIAKADNPAGEAVESRAYFVLTELQPKEIPVLQPLWISTNEVAQVEVGQEISVQVASAFNRQVVWYDVLFKSEVIATRRLEVGQKPTTITLPIKEAYRGNIYLRFHTVRHNRAYEEVCAVIVPFTNKQLDVSLETFRDKLKPGQQEEWRVRITGTKGEQVAAEFLASMYDASLDELHPAHTTAFFPYPSYGMPRLSDHSSNFTAMQARGTSISSSSLRRQYQTKTYHSWNFIAAFELMRFSDMVLETGTYSFGDLFGGNSYKTYSRPHIGGNVQILREDIARLPRVGGVTSIAQVVDNSLNQDLDVQMEAGNVSLKKNEEEQTEPVQIRTNFSETAFFFPQLRTDEKGDVLLAFTIPEALTRWKFRGMAHSKDARFGFIEAQTVTQKDLMVVPNAPRFLREGDRMTLSAKITNLSESDQEGSVTLAWENSLNGEAVEMLNGDQKINFTIEKGQSKAVSWEMQIPEDLTSLTYRVVARTAQFSDGQEAPLPVLSNRMLVTETLPLWAAAGTEKSFQLKKLTQSNTAGSMKHHRLTVESTANPAWYAVQALPYLMEFPHACAEQTFSRFYANTLASHLANSDPAIQQVFNSWKAAGGETFLSKLEKNQELKAVVLEETPWVMEANTESERKKRMGLLFDLKRMSREQNKALRKLQAMQDSRGGWPWFKGMRTNRYVTQHIVCGLGKLNRLGAWDKNSSKLGQSLDQSVQYLDAMAVEDVERYRKRKAEKPEAKFRIGRLQVHYLYARSFFPNPSIKGDAHAFLLAEAEKDWTKQNLYLRGMLAVVFQRNGRSEAAQKIIRSLREYALHDEEKGMYWKELTGGFYWYQAPIETMAMLIEAFDEVANDQAAVEEMKTWLLGQKQTQSWETTKATVEACYALLSRGQNLLGTGNTASVRLGGQPLASIMTVPEAEAGTGYIKAALPGDQIKPEYGEVTFSNTGNSTARGAIYWQYFEDLDKITAADSPLKLEKKFYREDYTKNGPELVPIEAGTPLKAGDKIVVQLILQTDRLLEFVHLKDQRAAGLEPINVISRYKWKDGLGFYEATKDASTNFFFDRMESGTYVFEYPLRVSLAGDFSTGIASIQCMYAPEFAAHSEGGRLLIK